MSGAGAQPITQPTSSPATTRSAALPRLDVVVERGLLFLQSQQNQDGSFGAGPKLGLTGVALYAFLRDGQVPDVGRYGLAIRNAADWLTDAVPPDGNVGKVDSSHVYGQVAVTLALCELYGVETDPQRRQNEYAALTRLVKVLLDAQAPADANKQSGGWSRTLSGGPADLSATTRVLDALSAAQQIGIDVRDDCFQRAVQFMWNCYREGEKTFAANPESQPDPASTRAALAALARYELQAPSRLAEARGAFQLKADDLSKFSYFDRLQAARIALHLDVSGNREIRDQLLQAQEADGGWPAGSVALEPGRVYATSMALLIFDSPRESLPANYAR